MIRSGKNKRDSHSRRVLRYLYYIHRHSPPDRPRKLKKAERQSSKRTNGISYLPSHKRRQDAPDHPPTNLLPACLSSRAGVEISQELVDFWCKTTRKRKEGAVNKRDSLKSRLGIIRSLVGCSREVLLCFRLATPPHWRLQCWFVHKCFPSHGRPHWSERIGSNRLFAAQKTADEWQVRHTSLLLALLFVVSSEHSA